MEALLNIFDSEKDWLTLIGQTETARIEFKSCRIFEKRDKAIEVLSQESSAFANTEGGVILIGIEERKEGKTRIADKIAGLSLNVISPEQLQQAIESSISPYLPAIRVSRVHFTEQNAGTVGFAIAIPQGSTAYQAKDMKYYGRSEFEKKPLPDNEVRLRMMRGRLAQASLILDKDTYSTAAMHNKAVKKANEIDRENLNMRFIKEPRPEINFDKFTIQLAVMNISDVSISDFVVEIKIESPFYIESNERQRFRFAQPTQTYKGHGKDTTISSPVIFPQDKVSFPLKIFEFHIPVGSDFTAVDSILSWTIFLENSPPSKGLIDIGKVFRKESLLAEQANRRMENSLD